MPSPVPTSDQQASYRWYCPGVSRAEAEVLLKKDSPSDGYFLVRDSTSAPGDFVLSVVVDGDVIHYQIHQHGHDAFFSMDEGPLIHGLDALVEHYMAAADGLAVQLNSWYPGSLPPATARLHGSSTLLHRAAEAGELVIVTELLKAGYSQLNSKDAQGQTALHLAARLGRAEVLQLLLAAQCQVNVRDSGGLMPLHYAARLDRAGAVRQLVDAGADLQARAAGRRRVPLHEAARCGSADAVRTLLALNAPSRPRDADDLTPAQLASRAGHADCAALLVRYRPPVPRRMRSDWLHGALSRAEAEQRLRAGGFNSGDYLLRTSSRKHIPVLSMVHDDKVYHFEIQELTTEDGVTYVYIDDGPYLDSLEHLVEHYSTLSDGLQCRLMHPVPPSAEDARQVISDSRLSVLGPPPPLPLPRLLRTGTISTSDLEFGAVIGDGEFGRVYQGRWRDPRGQLVEVAIKTHQEGEEQGDDREQLLREAACMRHLRHPCIVRFVGVVEHTPLMMVQELVLLGSLLDFLHDQPHGVSLEAELKLWAGQVAAGMEYLERERILHRDLAARNVLLASRTQAKISDFGFSRRLGIDRDYYVAAEGGRWPIKWYAPEAINFGTFSPQSDVWSFGVLLWEMFSYGEQPYGDMPGVQAFLEVVEKGQRLEIPEFCPGGIYELMLKCWAYEPHERPSFAMLHRFFNSDIVYRNLTELTTPQVVSLTSPLMFEDVADPPCPDSVPTAADPSTAAAVPEPAVPEPIPEPRATEPPLPLSAAQTAEPPAESESEVYDVLSAARSVAPCTPPPVPPKPVRTSSPAAPAEQEYDSPRSHRVETLRRPRRRALEEAAAPETEERAPLSPLSPDERAPLSPEEARLLRRPPAADDLAAPEPAAEAEAAAAGEGAGAVATEATDSAAPEQAGSAPTAPSGPLPPYSQVGPRTGLLGPYSQVGACGDLSRPTLCPNYTAPLHGLWQDSGGTYDVPHSASSRHTDPRDPPVSWTQPQSETYDVPVRASAGSPETYDAPQRPSVGGTETYDVPAGPRHDAALGTSRSSTPDHS